MKRLILTLAIILATSLTWGDGFQPPNANTLGGKPASAFVQTNGNGGGLTNVNALQLGGVAANILLSAWSTGFLTNPFSAWWSADIMGQTYIPTITSWVDRYGNAFSNTATYDPNFLNGRPAVTFNGSSQVMSNAWTLNNFPSLTNSGTLFIVYRIPNRIWSANATLISFGTNGNGLPGVGNFFINPYQTGLIYEQNLGGLQIEQLYPAGATAYQNYCVNYTKGDDCHCLFYTWSPTHQNMFLDGKCMFESTNQSNVGIPDLPLWQTPQFCIGGSWPDSPNAGPQRYQACGISELGLLTNQLNYASIQQGSYYFLNKYGLLKPQIVIDSDSIGAGEFATQGFSPQELIGSNTLGAFSITTVGTSGEASWENSNNFAITATTPCYSGQKILIMAPSGVNDVVRLGEASALPVYTNAVIGEGGMARSNNWTVFYVTPISNTNNDYNGFRGGNLAVMTNCWPTFSDRIIRSDLDPYVGIVGSWGVNAGTSSSYFYPGGVHPTNSGYAEWIPIDWMPQVNNVIHGTHDCFTTNMPPPDTYQRWTTLDANNPGKIYANSNGWWEYYSPGGLLP